MGRKLQFAGGRRDPAAHKKVPAEPCIQLSLCPFWTRGTGPNKITSTFSNPKRLKPIVPALIRRAVQFVRWQSRSKERRAQRGVVGVMGEKTQNQSVPNLIFSPAGFERTRGRRAGQHLSCSPVSVCLCVCARACAPVCVSGDCMSAYAAVKLGLQTVCLALRANVIVASNCGLRVCV